MNWTNRLCVTTIVTLVALASSTAVAQNFSEPDVTMPGLRDRLIDRMEIDQKARRAVMDSIARSVDGRPNAELVNDMRDVNTINKRWLSDYLADHPWPSITEVGKDGAHAAWIIVQHADQDRVFQRECLTRMRNMYDTTPREINVVDLAYLTDRVRVATGKPQLYGTQVMIRDGQFKPVEIEKPEELDVRRESLGLQSMDDYLFALRQNYARSRGNTTNR